MQVDGSLDENNADIGVELRYYNSKEYSRLTPAQKLGLKIKRAKRGDKPRGKPRGKQAHRGRRGGIDKRQFKNLKKRVIQAVQAEMGQGKKKRGNGAISRDSDDESV